MGEDLRDRVPWKRWGLLWCMSWPPCSPGVGVEVANSPLETGFLGRVPVGITARRAPDFLQLPRRLRVESVEKLGPLPSQREARSGPVGLCPESTSVLSLFYGCAAPATTGRHVRV